jgi:uncharacterized membrane protein
MARVRRHIAKAITYRILGSITTFMISFIFTGSVIVSGSISFVELIIKPINYFIHERVWYKYVTFDTEDS